VPGANSASGTDLQLSTCDTNGTAQSWVPANETTYIYDATGRRLMAVNASERTLYLGDTTVSMAANGAPAYTERYYAQPGAPTVMRSAYGTGSSTLTMQATDQNGTSYAEVTLAAGNAVKFNKLDPFGVKRNEHNTWRSHKGYIGGDDDRSTGLVHLGAREYDPHTGRFISPDPLVDLNDPVQMNGYVYCENNPITFADPTGLASESSGSDFGGPSNSEVAWANKQLNTSIADIILSVGWAALKEFVGWNSVVNCFSRGDLWACGGLFLEAVPWYKVSKIPKILSAVKRIAGAISALMKAKEKARKILEMARKAKEAARKAAEAKKKAAAKAAQLKKKAQQAATRAAKKAAQKTGNAVQKAKKAVAKSADRGSGASSKRVGRKDANNQPLVVKGRDQKNVGVENKGPESVTQGRRADGETVFSGHGTFGSNTGQFMVPQGTTLHFYVPHRKTLDDSVGLAVERGGPDAPGAVESFGPGSILPDYILGPPTNLNIMSGSLTVTQKTGISAVIKQGMGNVHMAMCREFDALHF
ncbi:RHS repeat-associated core domain-containing protein, partial [Streptomyces sp. NPDC047928]|uniref:RHS repeat-associated core domain-containing protein n=1 Tax=unclassified Streptomyces TaxID=2593676 RepID=UPI0037176EC0